MQTFVGTHKYSDVHSFHTLDWWVGRLRPKLVPGTFEYDEVAACCAAASQELNQKHLDTRAAMHAACVTMRKRWNEMHPDSQKPALPDILGDAPEESKKMYDELSTAIYKRLTIVLRLPDKPGAAPAADPATMASAVKRALAPKKQK
jgi:hypothetical protein